MNWNRARLPSLHHRKEGWPCDQENIAKPRIRAEGVVFRLETKGKPPRLRRFRLLRDVFLMTQPPLLAVMQGGESSLIPIHSQLHIDRRYRKEQDKMKSATHYFLIVAAGAAISVSLLAQGIQYD